MREQIPRGISMRRWIHDWVPRLTFLALGFVGGLMLGCSLLAASEAPDSTPVDAASDFRLMAEAWNTIQRNYVDRSAVVPERMTYGAISGMVDALGDTGHSRFLTPEMRMQEREVREGTFEGIGAELEVRQHQVVIVAPMDGSPAQRAGLRAGDIILRANGELISGLPLDQVVGRIAGPANTAVELTILTPSTGRTRDVKLVRTRVTLHSVSWHRLTGTRVAHVRIAMFSKGVTDDLRRSLVEIQREGLSALILDLRNDPGGLFDEAVGTASQFLAGGNVLLEKNSVGKVTPVAVGAGGVALAIPMAVLINRGTASAAEIVAGALKDGHRATLVGERTVGTGTILKTFPLSGGSALLLATKEWLTPAGHVIWHQGIAPDLVVPLPPDATPLLPEAEQGMTSAELRSSGDAQLLGALDLLQQRAHPQARLSPVPNRILSHPVRFDLAPPSRQCPPSRSWEEAGGADRCGARERA